MKGELIVAWFILLRLLLIALLPLPCFSLNSGVTPTCLRNLYGTAGYTPSSSSPEIGVMGYIGQSVSQADLTAFLNKYRSDAASYQIPIKTSRGATNDQSNPGVEAMLDGEFEVESEEEEFVEVETEFEKSLSSSLTLTFLLIFSLQSKLWSDKPTQSQPPSTTWERPPLLETSSL